MFTKSSHFGNTIAQQICQCAVYKITWIGTWSICWYKITRYNGIKYSIFILQKIKLDSFQQGRKSLREYHASKRVPLSPLINGNNSLLRDKSFTSTFTALFLVYITLKFNIKCSIMQKIMWEQVQLCHKS
jgi:hypothetical protein